MTVIRKRSEDKGGCCNPYSELQLEIERVDQTAIDAKTIANNAEATINANMGKINDAIAIAPQVETNTANISQHENRINTNTTNINKNTIDIQEQGKDITALKTKTIENENRINTNTININKNTIDIQEHGEDIVALKTKTNENENRINTNTTNINKNTTDIQKQSEDIVALKTKTNNNSAAIEALEDEVGPETVAGTIQYRLKNIDTKLPTAIKEVGIVADASTVTHKAMHISGTAESDALPVVSRTQAGIMSASVYAAMEDVIANNTSRISVLEQSALTYDISGLVSADPTNAEISAAFQQKYPNIPIQPGIRVADYNNAHFWQYGNNMWILLTQINIQTATNDSLGIVKGSDTNGKVFVETDGSMSLKGYDALVSKDATHDSKINTLEVGLGNANARIDATNTNVANNAADIVAANNEIATNTNDINGLKGRMATAEEQIATHDTKINQHTQSINGLTTDVNGLESRMSTAEGQISTNETNINQHTQSINGLSTDVNDLKSRMSTAEGQISTNETNINQHTQSINGLSTDVNGLKTDVNGLKTDVNGLKTDVNGLNNSKQDKLTAGTNITITNDVISAKGAPQWKVLQSATPSSLRTIYEMSASAITVKKTFRIKVCFGTINYDGGVHATLGSIEKGVYAINPNKSVCCVGAGATMVKEGNTNSALFIGWCLSKSKDSNTGSSLDLGFGYNIQVSLIGKDYQINTSMVSYDVNVDNCNTFNGSGSGPYTFCIEYLDE